MFDDTFEDKTVEPDAQVELPQELASDMRHWRAGWFGLPNQYIRFHEKLACKEWRRIKAKYDVEQVCNPYLVSDGQCDGMEVIEALGHRSDGKSIKLRWSDGYQAFRICLPEGGTVTLRESHICPKAEEAKSRSAFPWAYRDEVTF